jgi:glycosyltransferase involved in cell wall biosynthesis
MSALTTRVRDRIEDMRSDKFDLGVVVPTYNHGKFLKATLLSLLGQSFTSLKIIVVDDSSTDNTQEILMEFLTEPRISVIRNASNLGESEAVNVGWSALQTQFVAIISADDPQNLNWAEGMFSTIKQFPNFVGYYPNLQIINDQGSHIKNVELRDWDTKTAIERLVCMASAGTIYNKRLLPPSFVPRNKDVKYPSDLIQILNVARYGNFKRVENVHGTWRNSSDGLTATLGNVNKAEELHKAISNWLKQNAESVENLSRLHANLYSQMWKLYRNELSTLDAISRLRRHSGIKFFLIPNNQYNMGRAIIDYLRSNI